MSMSVITGSDLADSLLQTTDHSEALAVVMNGAELTAAERERLQEEADRARQQWMQKIRAKQIFNEAAAQMELKGAHTLRAYMLSDTTLNFPSQPTGLFGLASRLSCSLTTHNETEGRQ